MQFITHDNSQNVAAWEDGNVDRAMDGQKNPTEIHVAGAQLLPDHYNLWVSEPDTKSAFIYNYLLFFLDKLVARRIAATLCDYRLPFQSCSFQQPRHFGLLE